MNNTLTIEQQKLILNQLASGLDLCEEPFLALANQLKLSEQQVIDFIQLSLEKGVTKRVGMVVNHHQAGYLANAMVVWNVADDQVDNLGEKLGQEERVRLCYRRPRRLPEWPYNLFTMIHGQDRDDVHAVIEQMRVKHRLADIPFQVLFSTRKFKQTGARYDS